MPDGANKLLSELLSSGKGRQAPDEVVGGPEVRVSAEMLIEGIVGKSTMSAPPGEAQKLAPGFDYKVRVILRLVTDAGGFDIGDGTILSLEWKDCALKLEIPPHPEPIRTALLVEQKKLTREFLLSIPEKSPMAEGQLRLIASGVDFEPRELRTRKIKIMGRTYVAPEEFETKLQMKLQPDYVPRIARIYVVQDGEKVRVTAHHSDFPQFSATLPKLMQSIADVAGEKPSRLVWEAAQTYRQAAMPELAAWLDDVINKTKGVSIIITEHVDSRVPWEMIKLKDSVPPLGARVLVMRWTNVHPESEADHLDPFAKAEHKGSVLHFVDEDRLKKSKLEIDELQRCKGVPCKTSDELLLQMDDPSKDLAVLFLSCHGTLAKDQYHGEVLAKANAPGGGITVLELSDVNRPGRKPAVVVNACHSARVSNSDYGLTGLPNFFLAKYAESYFGTLGAVDEDFAAEVGRDLINRARSSDGVVLADFLFEMRQNAWKKFDVKKSERDYWSFVSAYMYVLYGPLEDRMLLLAK
ncbi:MAG: CHAT domain-containing protein [Peristeroidobacter soli]